MSTYKEWEEYSEQFQDTALDMARNQLQNWSTVGIREELTSIYNDGTIEFVAIGDLPCRCCSDVEHIVLTVNDVLEEMNRRGMREGI